MTAVEAPVRFRLLTAELDADALEHEMEERWAAEDLFGQVNRAREGAPEFVFYEGPPTANGRPGIHHVFSRTVKDLFCRYKVMRGHHVVRKAGWDTHGLPVEIEVEKQLGISGKQQIEEIGVEAFNRLCRESVWRYTGEWERLSRRIGYWLDYEHPYVTYSREYVESVWWALSTLHGRGLLVRGHKVLPYCPRCGTALSSHEVAQNYQVVAGPSVYVALELVDAAGAPTGRRALVWTTTPWTLPSNVALAVNPELGYVEVRRRAAGGEWLILAEDRVREVLGEDADARWETVRHLRGSELVGQRYRRPLEWVAMSEGSHEIIVGEAFVSAEDGSGIVHMAPAFGADDHAAAERHGLAFLQPVTPRGEFAPDVPVVGGQGVHAADPTIVQALRERGVLFRAGTIEHSYPHCWRCDTPLLYYARASWFVRTTALRDGMLARNARVRWQPPEMGEGRFGEWLAHNVDWALSRDRYWGTPLPVWVCDADATHVEVIGSYAELAARWGKPLAADFDPHKPFIDRYTWRCATCAGTMRRTGEVIDTWFDSGSMPFAQWHYPFEHREVMERHYPADFIAEGVDQTRGWFYSLLAIATGLGDALPNNGGAAGAAEIGAIAAPYRSVVVNDLVLDANGVKMSKSRGNIVDPWTVIPRYGADAVRLFLIAASQVWTPRSFDEGALRELAGRFLLTLRNVYSGIFAQYANFGWSPSPDDPPMAARPLLDRWVLSRAAGLETAVAGLLDELQPTLAARAIMEFVTDELSNWYVRRSRPRFYEVQGADNRAAFATLHEVLVAVCRVLAPFCPFITDWLHRELTGGESVHMAPFAQPGAIAWRDPELDAAMAQVRTLATLGRSAREIANINVRQPLSRVVCVVPGSRGAVLEALAQLLAEELNVVAVEFAGSEDALVRLEAKPNFRALGKRFGARTPLAAAAVAALAADALGAVERGERVAIDVQGESHEVGVEEVTIVRRAAADLIVQESGGYVTALDTTITPALRKAGIARELVSRIQRLRREAGFAVSDRIRLQVTGAEELERVARECRDAIAAEVLATDVQVGGAVADTSHAVQSVELDGLTVRIALTRV